jgi:hypothetical protein
VSSQATRDTVLRISAARKLISPRFPIGVPIIYNVATIFIILFFAAAVSIMQGYAQLLILVIIGLVLLWFGYSLFIWQWEKIRLKLKPKISQGLIRETKPVHGTGNPGDSQVCSICSMQLNKGDLVKTLVFPSITGGRDRLMHIRGCYYCIDGSYERFCPVCGKFLSQDEILIARMFERRNRRHVHVLGCNKCRPLRVM